MKLQSILCARLMLVAVTLSALAGCNREPETSEAAAPPAAAVGQLTLDRVRQAALGIETSRIRLKSVQSRLPAVGWLSLPPGKEVVISAPVAGFAVRPKNATKLQLGQTFRASEIVSQVNVFLSPQEISQLVQAKEDNDIIIQQSLSTMQISEAQLAAVSAADTRGAVSGVRIDQIKESLERSRAAYKQAQEKIPFLIQEPYEGDLLVKPVIVKAPGEGRVTDLRTTDGQFLNAGDPICTVADWSTLWLHVPLFEGDESRIDRTAAAEYPQGASSEVRSAAPVTVPLETKAATRTIDLVYEVRNPDWALRVGQSLTVALPLQGAEAALLIPRAAVIYDDFGAASCYVVSADGEKFQRRRIECEGTLESDMIVRRGLQADEVVVTVGAEQLAAEASKAALSVEDND